MLLQKLHTLHANETGAEEGMNKLLIFAIVALPLLALLIYFGKNIAQTASDQWDVVFGKKDDVGNIAIK